MIVFPGAIQLREGVRYDDRRRYRETNHPPAVCLHTVEGYVGRSFMATHRSPPHIWADPQSRQIWQTMDLAGPALALVNGAGGPETNHRGPMFQVELHGFARQTGTWPLDDLKWIAESIIVPLHNIARDQYGKGIITDNPALLPPTTGDDGYGLGGAVRMSADEWDNFEGGICCHSHVPENRHWDCGNLDLVTLHSLAARAADATTVPVPPPITNPIEGLVILTGDDIDRLELCQELLAEFVGRRTIPNQD